MNSVVLKLSGEFLLSENLNNCLDKFIKVLNDFREKEIKVAIVIGGGNLFRGREHLEMDEVNRDTIGMLMSVANAITLKDILSKYDIFAQVKTPFSFPGLVEDISNEEIINSKGIIIYGGGVGKINYSTDTLCLDVAKLLESKLIVKITKVDGIYTSDPLTVSDAKLLKNISYDEVINKKLNVMDLNIMLSCKNENIKIKVINMNKIDKILDHETGSLIGG